MVEHGVHGVQKKRLGPLVPKNISLSQSDQRRPSYGRLKPDTCKIVKKIIFTDYLDLHTLYYAQKKRFSALVMINVVSSHVIEIWPNYGQLTVFARKNLHARIRKLSEGFKKSP